MAVAPGGNGHYCHMAVLLLLYGRCAAASSPLQATHYVSTESTMACSDFLQQHQTQCLSPLWLRTMLGGEVCTTITIPQMSRVMYVLMSAYYAVVETSMGLEQMSMSMQSCNLASILSDHLKQNVTDPCCSAGQSLPTLKMPPPLPPCPPLLQLWLLQHC